MKSSHRRISRAMVAIVGGTLILAIIFWAYNLGKGHASAQQTKVPAPIQIPDSARIATAPPPTTATVPLASVSSRESARPSDIGTLDQEFATGS